MWFMHDNVNASFVLDHYLLPTLSMELIGETTFVDYEVLEK